MDNTTYNEKCPHCGSERTVNCVQSGYAAVSPAGKFTLKSQSLYHVICTDCGTVIRSFVKDPSKLIIHK